ncbi:hypothetical protein O6H91_15G035500 [Diphasiastrum complanatum]|uniref:Uncharacterized protein n=1 Tax=Diphasiastrum complanatum TaxID=34168 RepID=A0ACC2BHA1_DIPCM|nr:hypothetical protein O6H91_15G035500 [Diphasiastrum complanatum]
METKLLSSNSKHKKKPRLAEGESIPIPSRPSKLRKRCRDSLPGTQADAVIVVDTNGGEGKTDDDTPQVQKTSGEMQPASNGRRRRNRRRKHKKANAVNLALEDPCNAAEKQEITNDRLQGQYGKSAAPSVQPKANRLLDKMRARLLGGHFRMLNEILYTCSGEDALTFFKEDPASFNLYHAGYQEQISKWPQSPVEIVIDWLSKKEQSLIVADFGCDARLARSVGNKVHSFDLVSSNPSVIACNMAQTPLSATSVDVAVFCLSLMGKNYPEYLQEAHRVLKPRGWMLVAEVKSRFDVQRGGADVEKFVKALKDLGFSLMDKDDTNTMFVMFYFKKKGGAQSGSIVWPQLKPCIYKRR